MGPIMASIPTGTPASKGSAEYPSQRFYTAWTLGCRWVCPEAGINPLADRVVYEFMKDVKGVVIVAVDGVE